jgi:CHAT domain-containing protein/tetratricopeptide (TPR) repeat protein
LEQLDEQSKFRKYLLNDVGEEERLAIEERLLTDDEYFEEISMAEEILIQDYADENLDADERERFEKHFLSSEENRQKVKFARALRKYVNESKDSPETKKKPGFIDSLKAFFAAPVPVAVALLIIAGIIGFFVWQSTSRDSEALVAFNKLPRRPAEGRITKAAYAPQGEGTRGTNNDENPSLALIKSRATTAVLENETAENLHELGLIYLAEKNFDEAIKYFEKALKKNPNSAKLHNDFGVALIEKGRQKKDSSLESFAKANEEIEKAIELDKNLTEAYFNRAMVIELLNLPQAKEAWENYLKLDSNSQWANEAREHLQKLETSKPISRKAEEILQNFLEANAANDKEKAWQILSRNKEIITGKLIPQQLAFLFVNSKINRDESKAKKAVDALLFAGKLEEEKSGDLFWRDLAKYYSNVSNDKIPALKQAQKLYLEGVESCLKGINYNEAITKFESAQTLYGQAGNNLETKLIDFLIGYSQNRATRIEESNEKLNKLSDFCRTENYNWITVQANTWLATNDLTLKKFSNSLEKLDTALEIAQKIDDLFSQQKIRTLYTETYFSIARFDKAFDSIQESLRLGKTPDASLREKWRALNATTRFFYKIRNFHTASLFEQEALRLAQQLGDGTFEYTSSVDSGLISAALGKPDLALELIAEGQRISETFPEGQYKAKCFAHTNLLLGHIKRQRQDYSGASENYKRAAIFYDSSDVQVYSYDAHRGLLLSYLAEQNDEAFRNELPTILNIFDTYRTQIIEEQNRNSFFDNQQDVYDIAIDFEFRNRNYADAFNYSEQSRARSLLDMQNSAVKVSTDEKQPQIKFSTNITEPLNLSQIQAEMPENVQLLKYSVLGDKILTWLITKDNSIVEKTEISSEVLKEKVLTYFKLVSENGEMNEQRELSGELFKILISPVKEKLDNNKEIFIIPDKVLFQLPFNTLFSEKYLIEDYRISYAPSANVFLFCSKKAAELGVKSAENLLSVGNPTFNPEEYENALQTLPSAKAEAIEIAKLYENPTPTVMTENKATKEVFMENLKKADVVHFAGHYVVDEGTPLLSALVLAGNTKKESSLTNYEIIGQSLSNTRLIVLSACRTGIEKYYSGEGMIGASRTFLATGVPLVVTSQWSVDSEASKELMLRFHRFRKTDRLSTAESLRRAQIEMLRSEKYRQPYYWAAFSAIGGYTKF